MVTLLYQVRLLTGTAGVSPAGESVTLAPEFSSGYCGNKLKLLPIETVFHDCVLSNPACVFSALRFVLLTFGAFSKEPACAKGSHPSQGDSPHPPLPSRHQRNSKRRTMGRRTAYNPAFEPHVRASYRSVPAIQSKNHAGINPTHILGANRESAIREFFVIQFTARTSLFPRRV